MSRQTQFVGWMAFALLACGTEPEVVKEGLTEYQVYWEPAYSRYVQHGYYEGFHEDGALRVAGQYRHGNRIGLWIEWYQNGKKKGEINWADGKPEGEVTEWYENGQVRNRGTWKEGGRHGQSTWWYETGIKEKEVTYVDGEPHGVWTYWDSTGVVSKNQYWNRGEFLRVEGGSTEGY